MTSRDGQPVILAREGSGFVGRALSREPFASTPSEDWLQGVLDDVPAVLPISDVDERIEAPLFSLGREVGTDAGTIDNLFISRNGYVVVVETKLFRNPEARRHAVAQILDYAAQVRTWRYSRLNELSSKRQAGPSLYAAVAPEGFTEHEWIDRVNENLGHGRMALLIVGDGIHTETETLAEAVSGHPSFQFRLALIELRVFKLDDQRSVIVPATLLKTQEVERAIVTVRYDGAPHAGAPAGVVVSTPSPAPRGKKRSILSEEAYLGALAEYEDGERYVPIARTLLDLLRPPLQVGWTSQGFTVKVPDPAGSGAMLSLLAVPLESDTFAYTPWLRDQLVRVGSDEATAKSIVAAEIQMLQRFGGRLGKGGDNVSFDLLALEGKEAEFVKGLREIVAMIEDAAERFTRAE